MTGQEYVDEYATKRAETFPTAPQAHVNELEPSGVAATAGPRGNGERRSSADALSRWSNPA
jgi:hypothetical protein